MGPILLMSIGDVDVGAVLGDLDLASSVKDDVRGDNKSDSVGNRLTDVQDCVHLFGKANIFLSGGVVDLVLHCLAHLN